MYMWEYEEYKQKGEKEKKRMRASGEYVCVSVCVWWLLQTNQTTLKTFVRKCVFIFSLVFRMCFLRTFFSAIPYELRLFFRFLCRLCICICVCIHVIVTNVCTLLAEFSLPRHLGIGSRTISSQFDVRSWIGRFDLKKKASRISHNISIF